MRLRTIALLLIVAAIGVVSWGWTVAPANAAEAKTGSNSRVQGSTAEPTVESNADNVPNAGEGNDDADADGDTGAGEQDPAEEQTPEDPLVEREDNLGFGWWVAVIIAGGAAAFGIFFSLGRRKEHEAWLRQSAAACDTGHSVVTGLAGVMRDPSVLPLSQQNQARLDAYARRVEVLVESAPDERSRARVAPVHAAIQVVQHALDADEAPQTNDELEVAKAALDGALSEFAAAIDLESAQAGQPTSRPSA